MQVPSVESDDGSGDEVAQRQAMEPESDDETTKKITTTKVCSCHRCPSDSYAPGASPRLSAEL